MVALMHFKNPDVSVCFWFFLSLEQVGGKKKEKSIYCLLFLLDFITCLCAAVWVTGCCSLTFGVAIGNSCLDIK